MIETLTEEQKMAVIREHRNKKMREWYNKNKQHRSDYMREWNRKRRIEREGISDEKQC